jgi:recombination protein RecR
MTSDNLPSAAPSIARLVQELNRLPGIGPKSAQRLAYHIIRLPEEEAYALAEAVTAVKQNTIFCGECQNLAEATLCPVCADDRRSRSIICVVEDPMDVLALERTRSFRGLYHVLHGVISPINGIGPDQLKLRELLTRLDNPEVNELVVATNPTMEGEATAMYIQRHLGRDDLRVTRLARGLPVGGSLEHTDETTLSRAFQGRQEL